MVSCKQRDRGVDEDTPEMEPLSPPLGEGLRGDGRADDTNMPCFYGSTVPLDDTLPLGEDEVHMIEIQLLGEEAPPCMIDGETQMLDDPLDRVATDHKLGGKSSSPWTQPMDEYEDTEVVEDDKQGADGTVLLGDDDGGLPDYDAVTPCGVGCEDDRGETDGSSKRGTRTLPPAPCISEQGKREFPVASEVSAGEERGSGPVRRRSFTEVRIASLRTSGLAAACSTTLRTSDGERSPAFCNNHNREEKDDALVAEHNVGAGERYAGLTMNVEKSVDRKANVLLLDSGIENSDKCMENGHIEESRNRSGHEAISGGGESMPRMTENRNSAAPHLLSSDYSVAGLSYVDSQEPGEQSQANALDAIDVFLSINDLGFSQEVNPNKTCGAKTPVSCGMTAHLLARRGGYGSPVGKVETFDWVDTLEDEGDRDFFGKRKDFFFGNSEHRKKSRTKLLKSKHCDSILGGAYDKIGKTEDMDSKTDARTIGLTLSESRLKLHNSVSDEILVSQVKACRTPCKEIAGQVNEDSTVQHAQKTDVGSGEESMYDIGPDTQMAAEAMEALTHGSIADNELQNAQSDSGDIVGGSSTRATREKAASQYISLKNRGNSASDLGGSSIRRYKRIKMPHAEANLYSSNSSKESLKSSNMKRDLRRKARMASENTKTEELFCALKVQRKSRSSTSLKIDNVGKQVLEAGVEEVVKRIVVNGSKEVDECAGLLAPNDIISFSRKHVQRENNLNVIPVAFRTRRPINTVEKLGTSSEDYMQRAKDLVELRTVPAKRKQRGIAANAPQQLLDQGKGSNHVEHGKSVSSEPDMEKIITLPERPCKSNALLGFILGHQKRRRTHKSKSSNSTLVAENADVNLKSEKKKSIMSAAFLSSETDIIHGSVKGAPGIRTRSSIKSHPYTSEGDDTQGLNGDILTRASSSNGTHSTSVMNENVSLQEVEAATSTSFACFDVEHDVQLISDAQDAEGDARLKGSPGRVQPLGATSTAAENKLESLVCTSVDPLRVSNKKGLSKSLVATELIRLESMGASSVLKSKDLRRRRDITSVCVCLSHHLDDDIIKHQKKILARFGVSIVARVSDATHFIADKFVRTKNMLEAMAVGKPVVTHLWLESCGQASCFIDEKNYILRDVKKEREIGFSMPSSLAFACQRPLLQGKRVFITPNVKPDREHVADLVRAAQGQPMERLQPSKIKDEEVLDDLLFISCDEDFQICIPLLEKGAEVFSSELLLNGIVIQKLDYERHTLFKDHIRRTPPLNDLVKKRERYSVPVTKCT